MLSLEVVIRILLKCVTQENERKRSKSVALYVVFLMFEDTQTSDKTNKIIKH